MLRILRSKCGTGSPGAGFYPILALMRGSDRRGERQIVHHLLRVGPLVVSLVMATSLALVYLATAICAHLGNLPGLQLSYVVLVFVGGFLTGLVGTGLFNLIAPKIGGLPLLLSEEAADRRDPRPEEQSAADLLATPVGTSERKACPACGAKVRADRSFCPECDHSFEQA